MAEQLQAVVIALLHASRGALVGEVEGGGDAAQTAGRHHRQDAHAWIVARVDAQVVG
ncbi:hypothetical protein D3C84_1262110 [compost metagenome]